MVRRPPRSTRTGHTLPLHAALPISADLWPGLARRFCDHDAAALDVYLHERALHGRAGRISGPHIHAIEATPDPHHRSNPQHAAQTAVTALAHGRRMTTPLSSPPGGDRSEDRSVGTESVRPCRSRWSLCH